MGENPHDAFERLSDEALLSTVVELESLLHGSKADPRYVTQCAQGECEEPPLHDFANGHYYPKGARSVLGNGAINLAYCLGPYSYARFRQIFLQGMKDDAKDDEKNVKHDAKDDDDGKDPDARVTRMIAKLSVLPCMHVREMVARALRLREDVDGWMKKCSLCRRHVPCHAEDLHGKRR